MYTSIKSKYLTCYTCIKDDIVKYVRWEKRLLYNEVYSNSIFGCKST